MKTHQNSTANPKLGIFRRTVRRGLTLVEIVVVVALLGLLMTIVGGSLLGVMDDSKADATRLIIGQIESGLEVYNIKKGSYPKSLQDAAKYMKDQKVPVDAWNNDFEYSTSSSCGQGYEIVSLGKDGKKGGDDSNADISSCGEE